ncbi:hypothetical protein ES703_88093 [subsurface metagenome]
MIKDVVVFTDIPGVVGPVIAVFGTDGQQMPKFQGPKTFKLMLKIKNRIKRQKTAVSWYSQEFEVQELNDGNIVEFSENSSEWRFGVVDGGFGMKTFTIGRKIFGSFGATAEEAEKNHKIFLKENQNLNLPFRGFTCRQPCRIVGKLTIEEKNVLVR